VRVDVHGRHGRGTRKARALMDALVVAVRGRHGRGTRIAVRHSGLDATG
jgi:hypothetical protein